MAFKLIPAYESPPTPAQGAVFERGMEFQRQNPDLPPTQDARP